MLRNFFLLVLLLLSMASGASAESITEKKWYERFHLRGYAQLRYNQLGASNGNLVSDQGDKSIGDKNALFLRRARLIFSGDAGDYLSFYVQPDFASAPAAGVLHFAQLRDWYADIYFDKAREFRLRAGQSKVPFGFENLQSSQNRLPLDRNDVLNSAVKDERDLGLFFYWAPAAVRTRFKHLVDSGLKGSGDYGVIGAGLYNGQTANRSEANNSFHYVVRATYPFELPLSQIAEVSLQGYAGRFTVTRGTGIGGGDDFDDYRAAVSAILYPQPLGVQAEFAVGEGPSLNGAMTAVEKRSLHGGYVMVSYRITETAVGTLIPFTRWQYFRGGRKHETNAPHQTVNEAEFGVEWQPLPAIEVSALYTFAERTSVKSPYATERGRLARLQLQWNF